MKKVQNKNQEKGISLIALIITIIVIIILAAIVIFTGLNTPDRANLAKFMQEFSDFRTAVTQDYMQKKAEYAINKQSRSDAQIYYAIAKNGDYTGDINEKPTADGTVAAIGVTIMPEGLMGTDYYEITDDTNVAEWKNNKAYYEARGVSGERHFVTDKGEPFILPGYLVQENGTNKWYVNEKKYYVSEEPIRYDENGASTPDSETTTYTLETLKTKIENETGDCMIDEEGNIVPINIWSYEITGEDTCKLIYGYEGDYGTEYGRAYQGNITNGLLEYNIPVFIKIEDKPYKVTELGHSALWGAEIDSIIIPSTITSIGENSFRYSNLKSIVIPSNVKSIGAFAFYGCDKLESVTLQDGGLTNINSYAFLLCNELRSIVLPNSLTSIMGSEFKECPNLTNIVVSETNPIYDSRNNCNAVIEKSSGTLVLGGINTVIPNNITSIGSHSFDGRAGLTNITIPSNITTIEWGAFSGCTGISTIYIPSTVNKVDKYVFWDWTSSQTINIQGPREGRFMEDWNYRCNAQINYLDD